MAEIGQTSGFRSGGVFVLVLFVSGFFVFTSGVFLMSGSIVSRRQFCYSGYAVFIVVGEIGVFDGFFRKFCAGIVLYSKKFIIAG